MATDRSRRRWLLALAAFCVLLLALPLLPWPDAIGSSRLFILPGAIGAGGLAIALMLLWSPGLLDTYPRDKTLRIVLEALPPFLLYMLAIDRWPALLAHVPAGAWRSVATCAPLLLVLWACWAFVRYMRWLDELQQRVELVSVSLAAGLTAMVAAGAGVLHGSGAIGLPDHAGLWVFPLLAVAYSLIRTWLTRRYQ